MTTMLKDDDGWRDEAVLCAQLSKANTEVARYVLRSLDADAGREEPTSPRDENDLGEWLCSLGTALINRANLRRIKATRIVPGVE
ncbi:hypothetical protein [Actinokineospora spheciospongiae]|uniref:hypothetical protein n=1 Tax=Actinokineospora spheciospongiae TaxID=909613 RepID=UPI00055217C3|nr:hypothetical protein [Actinokineospora spheciospongiae]